MFYQKWRTRLAHNWMLLSFLTILSISLLFLAKSAVAADLAVPESTTILASTGDNPLMKDCSNTSVGLTPLSDLVGGQYMGFPGGLYPGSNDIPDQHLQMGLAASQNIVKLSPQGQPDDSGSIVFLSLGMSNTKQEFKKFMRLARGEYDRSVTLVNGAQGGYDAAALANPNSAYWNKVNGQLNRMGLSPLQVQVIWLKDVVADETAAFPQDAQRLQGYLRDIVLIIENRYPNVETIYLSSRAYGGYSDPDSPSPERWAYQSGFAVKWLIESQIDGSDQALAYNNAPWLAWGPYTWADGMIPRSDGLIWKCSDFESDGVHPGPSAETKVGTMLLDFFSSHPTTQWFPGPRPTG